ncbi:MAG: radical SAM protein [Chloroflexi bacterium]|nr:radical SAM protein [Chloroflexota bacterium]
MDMAINAAAFLKDSAAVGPGRRDAVWVQGCSILCPGCANVAFLPHVPRRSLSVRQLLAHFRSRGGRINGISVLGGEPTEQVEAVTALLEGVQDLGFSTVVFTGRVYENLLEDPDHAIHRLLAATDLLIDGPFVLGEYDPSLRWRGSRNQRLIYLTHRLRGCDPGCDSPSAEVVLGDRQTIVNGTVPRLVEGFLTQANLDRASKILMEWRPDEEQGPAPGLATTIQRLGLSDE